MSHLDRLLSGDLPRRRHYDPGKDTAQSCQDCLSHQEPNSRSRSSSLRNSARSQSSTLDFGSEAIVHGCYPELVTGVAQAACRPIQDFMQRLQNLMSVARARPGKETLGTILWGMILFKIQMLVLLSCLARAQISLDLSRKNLGSGIVLVKARVVCTSMRPSLFAVQHTLMPASVIPGRHAHH